MIDLIARELEMNYILDPQIQGGTVSINTYGDLPRDDLFPLLETILRMHGAAAVKVGSLYRISPAAQIPGLPISPTTDPDAEIPDDERVILNVIRFNYTTAADIEQVLAPFLGPGAFTQVIEQANMMLILDNSRNMGRTMELIALFDTEGNDAATRQAVQGQEQLGDLSGQRAVPYLRGLLLVGNPVQHPVRSD